MPESVIAGIGARRAVGGRRAIDEDLEIVGVSDIGLLHDIPTGFGRGQHDRASHNARVAIVTVA
jgi:hypothetical protein